MSFTKQFLLVLFFVKIIPVFFYPYTFDDFLYSNEEIAIAILFIFFVATIEKFFGQTFFDALLEKKNYLRELHKTFTKETFLFLKKQKENLEGMEQISETFPLMKDTLVSPFLLFSLKKEREENEINQWYERQLEQLLLVRRSNEKYNPMTFIMIKAIDEVFYSENIVDNS